MIRPAISTDSESIARIYNHYVLNTIITFEEEAVSAQEMSKRLNEIMTANLPWLVAELNGQIVGYAYASKWKGSSARAGHRFSVEISIYLAPDFAGQGIGSQLYNTLFSQIKTREYHSIIAGIALPNPASVRIHEKLGLTQVAHFREIGFKFNQWIDVGYWQCTL